MAVTDDKTAIVKELYSRVATLPPDKRAIVNELANRYGLTAEQSRSSKAASDSWGNANWETNITDKIRGAGQDWLNKYKSIEQESRKAEAEEKQAQEKQQEEHPITSAFLNTDPISLGVPQAEGVAAAKGALAVGKRAAGLAAGTAAGLGVRAGTKKLGAPEWLADTLGLVAGGALAGKLSPESAKGAGGVRGLLQSWLGTGEKISETRKLAQGLYEERYGKAPGTAQETVQAIKEYREALKTAKPVKPVKPVKPEATELVGRSISNQKEVPVSKTPALEPFKPEAKVTKFGGPKTPGSGGGVSFGSVVRKTGTSAAEREAARAKQEPQGWIPDEPGKWREKTPPRRTEPVAATPEPEPEPPTSGNSGGYGSSEGNTSTNPNESGMNYIEMRRRNKDIAMAKDFLKSGKSPKEVLEMTDKELDSHAVRLGYAKSRSSDQGARLHRPHAATKADIVKQMKELMKSGGYK